MVEHDDKLLTAMLEDRRSQCEEQYVVSSTGFLDAHEVSVAAKYMSRLPGSVPIKMQRGTTSEMPGSVPIKMQRGTTSEMPGSVPIKMQRGTQEMAPKSGAFDAGSACGAIYGEGELRGALFGGYEDAERRVAVFLPGYVEANEYFGGEESPIAVLRVKYAKGSRPLTHRDYLGSILALGLERSVVGDIIVCDDGADIIVLSDMSDFLLSNYSQAGHTSLSAEIVPIAQLRTGSIKVEHLRDTVASLRLDNLVSAAFKLSRGKAQEAVSAGLVFVDSIEVTKPDFQVEEGSKLVLRGKGKVILRSVDGKSKKDRICIQMDRYI